jgi:uncharacterized protein YlxW (UPF0749 family)
MINGQRVQKVQLGCGTLILIALIVLLFSNSGNRNISVDRLETEVRDTRAEVTSLKSEVIDLQRAIDAQTNQLRALQNQLKDGTSK